MRDHLSPSPPRVILANSLPSARVLVVDPCPDNAGSLSLLLRLGATKMLMGTPAPRPLESAGCDP